MKNIDLIISIIAIVLGIIAVALVIAPACHTDTECGCTDDCLEPATQGE